MKKIMAYLRFGYAAWAVLWFAIKGSFAGIFTDRQKFYRKRIEPSGRKIVERLGSSLEVKGLENLNPGENYVFVGNHRSYTDIVAMFLAAAAAHRDIAFMSKKEIFKIPFMGSAMKSIGIIGVDRGNSSKAMRSLIEAEKAVKSGTDLVIFPEGTRSPDGKLRPFKRGGFIIASRAGVKVAPFVIKGTEKFMPKKGFGMYPAEISVKFLPVIDTKGVKDNDVLAKAEKAVREAL